jgi:recombinational DNA repair protein RecR
VLGGLLPSEPPGARALLQRCRQGVQDVILALGPEDQARTTERWLADLLRPAGVDVWALGRGVAYGMDIEHAAPEEIVAALAYRRAL